MTSQQLYSVAKIKRHHFTFLLVTDERICKILRQSLTVYGHRSEIVIRRHLWFWVKSRLSSLVQTIIQCRLDYCNSVLIWTADVQMKRLQWLQNTATHAF